MLPLVSWPVSRCLGVCPPDLCGWRYLAWVWVEGHRRRCPPDGLEVFNASRHTERINSSIFRALDSPRSYWCSSLSAPPPPPPFPVQPYLSRYPPYQRESIFVVAPLALSPSVPPGPGPINLLNTVRDLFHVPHPYSVAMLVVWSQPKNP